MADTTRRDFSSPQRIPADDWRKFQAELAREERNRKRWAWAILIVGVLWVAGLIWLITGLSNVKP